MTWKNRVRLAGLAVVVVLAGAGCGGITASHSVSPASFFMPGLLKSAPQVSPEGRAVGGPVASPEAMVVH